MVVTHSYPSSKPTWLRGHHSVSEFWPQPSRYPGECRCTHRPSSEACSQIMISSIVLVKHSKDFGITTKVPIPFLHSVVTPCLKSKEMLSGAPQAHAYLCIFAKINYVYIHVCVCMYPQTTKMQNSQGNRRSWGILGCHNRISSLGWFIVSAMQLPVVLACFSYMNSWSLSVEVPPQSHKYSAFMVLVLANSEKKL